MNKLLTIVIPSYNVEKTLRQTVESLLVPDMELRGLLDILIVNDGSKDGTLDLARQLEADNPGIVRVWDKENGGHGSTIGARRHHGFIPWDDDVDIAMPRPDYERFAKMTREKFPDFLELRWCRNTKKSPFQYIKLVDNRTTLKEIQYNDYVEGLYIDIFPLDGVKSHSFFERLRCERIWLLHKMVIINCSTKKRNHILKRIVSTYIKTLDLNKLHAELENQLKKVSYNDCNLIANFLGAWGKREIVEKRLFGRPVLYLFEDTAFFGPEKIDEYLYLCVWRLYDPSTA